MADRLEDFQKFRADLNEEILAAAISASSASSLSTIRLTNPARSALRTRNCSGSSPPRCYVAMTALRITWSAVAKKAGSVRKSLMRLTSP